MFYLDESDALDTQIRKVETKLTNLGLDVEERYSKDKFHGWTIYLFM